MVRPFSYNTYGHGRTYPHSPSEAHWRDMGIKLGLQMRRPKRDPAHRTPPMLRPHIERRLRGRKESLGAFLTP